MKGNSLVKIGRPSKYSPRLKSCVTNYTNLCLKNNNFPTIEGLARSLGISTRTIYGWENEFPEFLHTMEALRDTQRDLLIRNGLSGKYSTSFSIFLLKAIHGFSDFKPIFQATQQNTYMDISPEVMADALKLMHAND